MNFFLSYTVPSFKLMNLKSAIEVVRNDRISVTCSVQVSQTTASDLQLMPSIYVYSGGKQCPAIVSSSTVNFTILALPEILPSYGCDINFTFSRTFSAGHATNLPLNISLMTQARQVLCKYFLYIFLCIL